MNHTGNLHGICCNVIHRLIILNVCEEPTFTSLAVWISFSFSIAWTFSVKHKQDSAC